jgi:hypothetical protein
MNAKRWFDFAEYLEDDDDEETLKLPTLEYSRKKPRPSTLNTKSDK